MSDPLHNEFAPDSIEARSLRHLINPNSNLADVKRQGPKVHVRAKGVYIWDNHGKQYIEGLAGLWCTALGYGVEELAQTAKSQMEEMAYSQLFTGITNEPSVRLAEMLMELVPIDSGKVFFGLSGSDANDTQVKLQWHYSNLIGAPARKKIISRWQAYHGVTVVSGSLTGLPPFHKNFDLPIAQVKHTNSPFYYREAQEGETEEEFTTRLANNLEELIQEEGPETIAAFIAEPILGAGGVIVPPDGYYEKLQRVLKKHRIHFIADEVINGFWRTGETFGCQTMGIEPTTMSIAKALSSAYLPISAVVIPDFMFDVFERATEETRMFGHGFTYSGHPVAAAVAVRNLELMKEWDIATNVAKMTPLFQERLASYEDHPLVGNTRGRGLLGAVELVKNKETREPFEPSLGIGAHCMARCREHGLISRAVAGDSLAFCPPLIITADQIDEIFSKFDLALADTLKFVNALDS
ncbi:MAG: aminotransferase class III-fold pyridoxal phosphate-dependent enzyme [Gammaproteobacteria bacterium]|nr:aminotransferase class III-fold pyridoxal phosphate-dependent enzyme [Gammaproteobacteria bacterium]